MVLSQHVSVRTVLLGVVAMVTVVLICMISPLAVAVTLTATALIVPGTGTMDADAVAGYRENFRDYYIGRFNPLCRTDCNLQGVDYPAQFWPVPLPGWAACRVQSGTYRRMPGCRT